MRNWRNIGDRSCFREIITERSFQISHKFAQNGSLRLACNRRLGMSRLNLFSNMRRLDWLGNRAGHELFAQRGFQIGNELFQNTGFRNWFCFRLRSCKRGYLHRDFFNGWRDFFYFYDRLFHGSRDVVSDRLRGGNVLDRDFFAFDRDFDFLIASPLRGSLHLGPDLGYLIFVAGKRLEFGQRCCGSRCSGAAGRFDASGCRFSAGGPGSDGPSSEAAGSTGTGPGCEGLSVRRRS